MTRKFLLSGFGVFLLAFGSVGQAAPIQLYDFALNIDDDIYDIVFSYEPLNAVPAGVDASGFAYIGQDPLDGPAATGLGSIIITITGVGMHNILAYFDHELDEDVNGFDNESGGTGGAAAAGQSWEIDEPGFGNEDDYYGDIRYNFEDNALDNRVFYDAIDDWTLGGASDRDFDDVAMAMGWNFTLAADETAEIVFTVGTTAAWRFLAESN